MILATILSTKPKLAMFILLPETLIYLKCVYKCYLNPKRGAGVELRKQVDLEMKKTSVKLVSQVAPRCCHIINALFAISLWCVFCLELLWGTFFYVFYLCSSFLSFPSFRLAMRERVSHSKFLSFSTYPKHVPEVWIPKPEGNIRDM